MQYALSNRVAFIWAIGKQHAKRSFICSSRGSSPDSDLPRFNPQNIESSSFCHTSFAHYGAKCAQWHEWHAKKLTIIKIFDNAICKHYHQRFIFLFHNIKPYKSINYTKFNETSRFV